KLLSLCRYYHIRRPSPCYIPARTGSGRAGGRRRQVTSRSERPANGESEHAPFFEVRQGPSVIGDGIDKRIFVWEGRAVGYDRRLQILAHHRRVVGPIEPERRVYHRQHDLKFDAGGGAQLLGSGGDLHAPIETGLWELVVKIRDAAGLHGELAGAED